MYIIQKLGFVRQSVQHFTTRKVFTAAQESRWPTGNFISECIKIASLNSVWNMCVLCWNPEGFFPPFPSIWLHLVWLVRVCRNLSLSQCSTYFSVEFLFLLRYDWNNDFYFFPPAVCLHRALWPSLSLGGKLRREAELPFLLHVYPLALLPHHLHLRLRHHAHYFT